MKLNAHKFKIYNFKASTKFKFVNKKSSNISLAMLAYTICLKMDTKKVLNNPNHIWHELKKKIKSFSNQTSVVIQFFFLQISRFIFFYYTCHTIVQFVCGMKSQVWLTQYWRSTTSMHDCCGSDGGGCRCCWVEGNCCHDTPGPYYI